MAIFKGKNSSGGWGTKSIQELAQVCQQLYNSWRPCLDWANQEGFRRRTPLDLRTSQFRSGPMSFAPSQNNSISLQCESKPTKGACHNFAIVVLVIFCLNSNSSFSTPFFFKSNPKTERQGTYTGQKPPL